ncbi:MAG: hypothetical protein ACREA0_23295, partial [bacterium]
VIIVVAIGGLGQRMIHHRITADSNSAAMSLAEQQMEKLLADPNRNPAICPGADLCSDSHNTASGHFTVQWTVTDNTSSSSPPTPLILSPATPSGSVKTIKVTVTHTSNRRVYAQLVRSYKVSSAASP